MRSWLTWLVAIQSITKDFSESAVGSGKGGPSFLDNRSTGRLLHVRTTMWRGMVSIAFSVPMRQICFSFVLSTCSTSRLSYLFLRAIVLSLIFTILPALCQRIHFSIEKNTTRYRYSLDHCPRGSSSQI